MKTPEVSYSSTIIKILVYYYDIISSLSHKTTSLVQVTPLYNSSRDEVVSRSEIGRQSRRSCNHRMQRKADTVSVLCDHTFVVLLVIYFYFSLCARVNAHHNIFFA